VGLFSRLQRQPAEPPAEAPLGSFANPDGQPVLGNQAPGPMWGVHPSLGNQITSLSQGLAMMRQMGPMITNGAEIRDEMFEVMRRHGIDPTKGIERGQHNPSDLAGMEQEILQVYSRHGIDIGALEQQGASLGAGQVPAMSGELRDELMEIMKRHGVDPAKGMTGGYDPSEMSAMQQEIMAAYSRHGFNLGLGGAQPPS
jgi:septum formation topological specificity factor MinE